MWLAAMDLAISAACPQQRDISVVASTISLVETNCRLLLSTHPAKTADLIVESA